MGLTLACRLRSGKRREVQFFHLPRIDGRWRIGHQVDRGGEVFGKAITSRIDGSPARSAAMRIETQGDAAMRRRAELERVDGWAVGFGCCRLS